MADSPSPDTAVPTDAALRARQQRLTALLSRVALGDRVAFDTLYREVSAHLFGTILRIQRDQALAEEVLQEVFVNVWHGARSFNPALAQASTWLGSIARNRAIDSLRRRHSEPNTVSTSPDPDDEQDDDMLEHTPSDEPGPLALLERASEARALQRCMQGLSADQQQALALTYYQGLSHTEVAEHLMQPLGTVKSWVRRGLLGLKDCLERAAQALG